MNAALHYMSIPDTTEKFLVEFASQGHFLSTDETTDWTSQAAYIMPFLKLFLEDDERYRPYLYSDMTPAGLVSRYEHSRN